MLYELFVSETGPKCNCLVDIFATSLQNMHAYTHAHCRSLFKFYAKLDLVIDRSTYIEDFNCLLTLKGVQYMCLVMFYSLLKNLFEK